MTERAEQRLAVWVAPIMGTLATTLTLGIFLLVAGSPTDLVLTIVGLGPLILVLPILGSAWIFGMICSVVLERWHMSSVWVYALVGVASGIVGAGVWYFALSPFNDGWHSFGFGEWPPGTPPPDPVQSALGAAAFFGIIGALAGTTTSIVYWLMVRPDRHHPNPASTAS